MSSDVGWHTRDKLWLVPKHGSMLLYVYRNHKAPLDGKPRTATSTFTQLLNSYIYIYIYKILPSTSLWCFYSLTCVQRRVESLVSKYFASAAQKVRNSSIVVSTYFALAQNVRISIIVFVISKYFASAQNAFLRSCIIRTRCLSTAVYHQDKMPFCGRVSSGQGAFLWRCIIRTRCLSVVVYHQDKMPFCGRVSSGQGAFLW